MDSAKLEGAKQMIELPIVSISRFEKGFVVLKEKCKLIVISTILLVFTSLSFASMLVNTLITTPSLSSVLESISVESLLSAIMYRV